MMPHSDHQHPWEVPMACTKNSASQPNPVGTLALPLQISKRYLCTASAKSRSGIERQRVDVPLLQVRPLSPLAGGTESQWLAARITRHRLTRQQPSQTRLRVRATFVKMMPCPKRAQMILSIED